MSRAKPKHLYKKKRRSRLPLILVLLFLAFGLLYAGVHSFFQAPELPGQKNPALPVSTDTQDEPRKEQSVETEAEQAAEAARKAHFARKKDCYTILISGLDNHNGGADSNILVTANVGEGFVHAVSIPRDTKSVYGGKSHKINADYNSGGMERLAEVVSDQLGIPVDYTVTVDLNGFVRLVDAIGGVDFDIPVNMNYDDPTQNLSIHFSKGRRHLSGKDAIKVVRFRHNNDGTGYGSEDIGRMKTQQDFLKAVAQKMLSPSVLKPAKISELAQVFSDSVETNGLTVGNLVWLATEMVSMGPENISFATLPGQWKSPYIYLDEAAVLEEVNTYLNPYVEDRTPEDLNIP